MLVKDVGLFRPEAVEFQRRRLAGEVILRPDPPLSRICLAFGVLVVALIVTFARVTLPVAVHVRAQCAYAGRGLLDAKFAPLSDGTQLQSAQIAVANGAIVATWRSAASITPDPIRAQIRRGTWRATRSSVPCEANLNVVTHPAYALIHRLFRQS